MIEEKLNSLGIKLPLSSNAIGSYVPIVTIGNLVFVSGQIPVELASSTSLQIKFKGKVGKDISIEAGQQAAKLCVINALTHLKGALGSLDNIKQFVKISGYVNCDSSFSEQHIVLNGASNFIVEIFGEKGRHARIAMGTNSLPVDSAVEIDFIVEKEEL
jgi:enamine deaminase RidA (YjgF/YER057c/UK114 family)